MPQQQGYGYLQEVTSLSPSAADFSFLCIDVGLPDWNPALEESTAGKITDSVEADVNQLTSSLYCSGRENSVDLDDSSSERSRSRSSISDDSSSGSGVSAETEDVKYYSPFGTGVTSWLADSGKDFRCRAEEDDIFGGAAPEKKDSTGTSPASSCDEFLPIDRWAWNQRQTFFRPEMTSPSDCDVIFCDGSDGGKRRERAIGDEMKTKKKFLSSRWSSGRVESGSDDSRRREVGVTSRDEEEEKHFHPSNCDDFTKLAAILIRQNSRNPRDAAALIRQRSCGCPLGNSTVSPPRFAKFQDAPTRLNTSCVKTAQFQRTPTRLNQTPMMYVPMPSYYMPMMSPFFHPPMVNRDYLHSSFAAEPCSRGYPYILPQQTFFHPSNDARNFEKMICFDAMRSCMRRYAAELHVRLTESYDEFRRLESERKKVEAELTRQNPGKSVTSCDDFSVPSMTSNSSRIDRLVVEMLQEHSQVVTLLSRMEQLCGLKFRMNLEATVDYWLNDVQKLQTCRNNEVLHRKKRCHDYGAIFAQKQKDIISLTEALADVTVSARRVRNALCCAMQLSSVVELPERCTRLTEEPVGARHSHTEPAQRSTFTQPPFEMWNEINDASDYEDDDGTEGDESDF